MTDVGPSAVAAPRGRLKHRLALVVAAAIVVGAGALLTHQAYAVLPPGLTGEADRLAILLGVRPGMVVAEIGAGSGSLTVELARHVGPGGRVYSTELSQARLADIRRRVESDGLTNVVVVEAGEAATNLPDSCCAAIVMRNVYHHIGSPRAFNASLRRTVADGGLVAIIDFEPGSSFGGSSAPAGASPARSGHGVRRSDLANELGEAGFVVEQEVEEWGGSNFLVVFRAR